MNSITLEIRPRLRSLNAYISLKESIDNSRLQVRLGENDIKIEIQGKLYSLSLANIHLLPSSLSSLRITDKWISFRIQTEPNYLYGKFETEIIKNDDINYNYMNLANELQLPPKNKNCQLICARCENRITKIVNFQRILPLPSSGCDPQEWFCHKHGKDEPFSMDPKESDLFYSSNYCLFNTNVFEDRSKLLNSSNSLVQCNRCFAVIGSAKEKNIKSLKIWNCCINYKIIDDDSVIKIISSPLSDFLTTFKHTSDYTIGEKILLEAEEAHCTHHIILKTMEKKLHIQKTDQVNLTQQSIDLESSFVVKVFYKYGESKSTIKNNDPDVEFSELPLSSFISGMEALMSSTARFPPAYRKAEDYYIGYLPL
ncbi:hypothetical protein TKK_0012783 [Trichogramma kaykai]|uniref:E3 ubiquitin-protein ligase E3D n=1 Tax=Trichogramma kaykai TaxID=54128 RepID=A0ABD2WKQ9_9HYME